MYDSSRDDDSTEAEYANWEPHLQNQNEQGRQPSGGDGRRSRYSRLLAVFAVCVALLCVLLLSFTIVQSVKLNNMTGERDEWKISYYKVSVKRDQLHSERNKLQAERDQLQSERDQLQSERDQLQGERDQLQSERDELQKWSKMWNYTIHHSLKYFTTNETSWSKAREECRSKGADLVIINSREEHEYISGVFAGEAWIGLHDTVQEGKWMWVDGTEVTTKFWRKGEPNIYGGIEDCAATGSKYAKAELTTWADYSCETVFQAICEKRANI
ncbi:hepatic lectin-like isoform X2 [Tachysurus fulvidraco]|uniref:hepatic lectin-like isoform X2 n=1 Tax=Tachysurus fulvidraco TaxID=1234273 RepID=UPI001FEEC6F0|nr:hepatic lectin-like isoform X2 [Tachysurus fulvidraco]